MPRQSDGHLRESSNHQFLMRSSKLVDQEVQIEKLFGVIG